MDSDLLLIKTLQPVSQYIQNYMRSKYQSTVKSNACTIPFITLKLKAV